MPKVYNKRDKNVPTDAVYVGRPSDWGNPFKVGCDGTRAEVVKAFEGYAEAMLQRHPDWLTPLRGKDLVCWCAPKACHADVILRLANKETWRPFAIKGNAVNVDGFRVVLCKGEMHTDGSVAVMWVGKRAEIDKTTGKRVSVALEKGRYPSMDALLSALSAENVRCIYWNDTKQYEYISAE